MKRTGLYIFLTAAVIICLSVTAAAGDYLVGDSFPTPNAEGYWGPYGPAVTLYGGALVFDTSIPDAWVTLDYRDDIIAPDTYRYAVVTIKADDPGAAAGATMTFGDVRQSLAKWGITLNETYTTHALDLAAHGITKWGDAAQHEPDFAMNKAEAGNTVIYVDKILLTNNPPVFGGTN